MWSASTEQWQRERQAADHLVNRVGSARHDCPASAHPFSSALTSIRDLLAGGGEVSPYVPHWRGDIAFQSEQRVRRLLNLRRTKKRSAAQDEELERIRAELAAGAEGSA
jgi:hypothetical protein